jgi:hypothetical protein
VRQVATTQTFQELPKLRKRPCMLWIVQRGE